MVSSYSTTDKVVALGRQAGDEILHYRRILEEALTNAAIALNESFLLSIPLPGAPLKYQSNLVVLAVHDVSKK